MAATVSDFMLEHLHQWGVRRVYGYPGDGINGILGAVGRNPGLIELIQVRHEEEAAFMASAHAKYSNGKLGVCLATSGPGAIHLLNGLYDARKDHQPVVDLASLFKDVAGDYVQTAMVPAQMRHLIDESVRIALSQRCVT